MKWIITLMLSFLGAISFAQNEDVIDGFMASEFNGKVLLTWSIKQGYTCNGVQVLRSTDSVNFTQIGSIEGICGSSSEKIDYEFTDFFPVKNAINYYRLSLGGVGFSWIIQVEVIDIGANNYLLRPNPVESDSELHFDNETNSVMELKVYSGEGILVSWETTTSELFYIRKEEFAPGMYFFTVSKEGVAPEIKGKFMVR